MTAGVRTTQAWQVGEHFAVVGTYDGTRWDTVGRCVSVTPWGNGRTRWVRLRFTDGTEKSYAPSHLHRATPDGRVYAP